MILSAIVAVADNDVISKQGKIPWHMPADFARLKKITMSRPIIMGRKTHDSIGTTLPGRTNIVISRNPNYKVAAGSILVGSLDEALELAGKEDAGEAFIFGGEAVYNQAMPKTQRLYLTRVHTTVEDGDGFFRYNPDEWQEISSEARQADANNPFDLVWYGLERKK